MNSKRDVAASVRIGTVCKLAESSSESVSSVFVEVPSCPSESVLLVDSGDDVVVVEDASGAGFNFESLPLQ